MPVDVVHRALVIAALALAACRSHRAPARDDARSARPAEPQELHSAEAPLPDPDPRHADHDGAEAHDDTVRIKLSSDGIYRRAASDPTWVRLARSFPTSYRKALVLDRDRAYWIEPAAGAVLSVPIAGGPVSLVCLAETPVDDDLAIHGDTLYLASVGGSLVAADKHGGPRRYLGIVSDGFGIGRNSIDLTADDAGLHVVTTSLGMSDGEPTESLMSLLVTYPTYAGEPMHAPDHGLLFAPSPALLQEHPDHVFSAIATDVRTGRAVITVVVPAPLDADNFIGHLHTLYGPAVRTEVVVTPPPPGRPSDFAAGISADHLPSLFTP